MTNCSWVHCKTLESNFSIIFRLHLLLTAHHLLISRHITAKLTALCWDLGCFGTVLGPPWAIWGPHEPILDSNDFIWTKKTTLIQRLDILCAFLYIHSVFLREYLSWIGQPLISSLSNKQLFSLNSLKFWLSTVFQARVYAEMFLY